MPKCQQKHLTCNWMLVQVQDSSITNLISRKGVYNKYVRRFWHLLTTTSHFTQIDTLKSLFIMLAIHITQCKKPKESWALKAVVEAIYIACVLEDFFKKYPVKNGVFSHAVCMHLSWETLFRTCYRTIGMTPNMIMNYWKTWSCAVQEYLGRCLWMSGCFHFSSLRVNSVFWLPSLSVLEL